MKSSPCRDIRSYARLAGLLFVLVLCLAAGPAVASESAHGADGATGAAHATVDGDHWSILTEVLPPAFAHNLRGMMGQTYVAHEPVSKIAHMFMAGLAMILLLGMGLVAHRLLTGDRRDEYVAPSGGFGVVVFFEVIVGSALETMTDLMGAENARRYFPLIGGLAFFILISNLLGSIPGFLPPTDNWNTTLALGMVVFLAYNYYGFRKQGLSYMAHFFGPIRAWYALPLMLFMFLIEMIGHVVRPMSLSIRLMGNIFGDHTVLAIFLGFHLIFLPLPIMMLGFLVAVVQTFVFCLLAVAYISMAVAEEEH